MKQVLIKSGEVVLDDVPAPSVRDGHILVANMFSIISSGTESSNIQNASGGLLTKALRNPELIKTAKFMHIFWCIASILASQSCPCLPLIFQRKGHSKITCQPETALKTMCCKTQAHFVQIANIFPLKTAKFWHGFRIHLRFAFLTENQNGPHGPEK